VNSKKLAGAGAAAIGAATAVTALLLGSTTAVADEARVDSAYGIAAGGLLNISPVPYVESKDGSPQHDQLLGLTPAPNVSVGVLTVDARGGAATTSVAKVDVLDLVKADLITTSCKNGDEGTLEIVKGSVLGTPLPRNPISNTTVNVSPLLRVSLGDQTRNEDGSLTVTGIELSVLPGSDDPARPLTSEERQAVPGLSKALGLDLPADTSTVGQVLSAVTGVVGGTGSRHTLQHVTIGSATCSPYDDDGHHKGDHAKGDDEPAADDDPGSADAPEAPRPEVVQANLPVTG
jgi:hypothetical protein